MSTRPLIIPNSVLLAMADLPADARVVKAGPTGTMEQFDGIYAEISSESFRSEDQGKVIELTEGKQGW